MKKIVPFKKDIIFNTNISEITSISLEHTLKIDDQLVTGNFILSGEYKIADDSKNIENFSYDLPFNINFDDKYKLTKAVVDINDFYYEIINENILSINIEASVDNVEEIVIEQTTNFYQDEIREEIKEENIIREENIVEEKRCIEEEDTESLFGNLDESLETYKTYKICIVREGDSIENILIKYEITKDTLELYNDLTEIKIGDKLIIPATYEAN